MEAARPLYLFTAPGAPLPSHRREAFSASATLHLLALAIVTALPAAQPRRPAIMVAYVPPAAVVTPKPAPAPAERQDSIVRENPADGPVAEPLVEIAGLDLDVEKVRRHRQTLFPFVTAPLPFLASLAEKYEPRPDRLVNPFGPEERRPSSAPPLALDDAARQRVIDRAWSRRERWANFEEIAALLTTHDPDVGDAPTLLRSYLEQNLLQPYFDTTTRDPRFWVMLALAADHTRLIAFVDAFVRQHPSSRTTTELLFMLDEFTQASRDALLMLLSTAPQDLGQTLEADQGAFALAVSVHAQYLEWARSEGLDRTEALRARFDDVRLRILRAIIASTPGGYGAADARFLAGRIMWDRNDRQGALRWWRDITPDARDSYIEASTAIAREIAIPGEISAVTISLILGGEYRRWIRFSTDRLASFGFEVDSF